MSANALHALAAAFTSAPFGNGLLRIGGSVVEATPTVLRVDGLSRFLKLGQCVEFGDFGELGEVIRIDERGATVKAYTEALKVGLGTRVWARGPITLSPDVTWKGRILDAFGQPIDGLGDLPQGPEAMPLDRAPPAAMQRQRLQKPARTGIKVIDLFTPLCAGQRIGIFAGSGLGKSTLLAMLAKAQGFDTVVIALVGERGREVREFIEDNIGASRDRLVAVVATADESAMRRRLAPRTAMCIAEYFRDQGSSVLLIVDSITRFAHAVREVELAAGEPPVARGYTPGVFSELPKLLERAGTGCEGAGSITGIFSVLVDGDDHNDPIADSIRGTLDGHVVLDRAIADHGRYPAVDLLRSISRVAHLVWTTEQQRLILKLRGMIARFDETRDLRVMGGYKAGEDQELDRAVELVPKLYAALQQSPRDPVSADAFQDLARHLSN